MTEALADMAITAGLPRRQKRQPKNKAGKDQLDPRLLGHTQTFWQDGP
jgi:hypothetical protein